MDWLGLLAVQGTLESLLQHHSWKTPFLWCSACFMVQPSICTSLLELYGVRPYFSSHICLPYYLAQASHSRTSHPPPSPDPPLRGGKNTLLERHLRPVSKGHRYRTPNQAKPRPAPSPAPLAVGLPSLPGPHSHVSGQPEGVGVHTQPKGSALPHLGASHSSLQTLPTPERPRLGPKAGSDPPPLPRLGTPSTVLTGALPTVGEDRMDGGRAQPLTQRAKQRRLREVRSELALHNQEADGSHGSSAQITRPPRSVLSSRTGRHPPQQAARPGATQPCLWPAGESGAGAPF